MELKVVNHRFAKFLAGVLLLSLLPITTSLVVAPSASADLAPTTVSAVTVSVDGSSAKLSRNPSELNPSSGIALMYPGDQLFGYINTVPNPTGQVREYITVKNKSSFGDYDPTSATGGSLFYFTAQGGVVLKTASDNANCGASTAYRLAEIRVTGLNLSASNSVYVFHDSALPAGGLPHFKTNIDANRISDVNNLEKLCDNTPYISSSDGLALTPSTIELESIAGLFSTASYKIDIASNTTELAFKVYVPASNNLTNFATTTNAIALGFLVTDDGLNPDLDNNTDLAFVTQIYSDPWNTYATDTFLAMPAADERVLAACATPDANDDPCYVASDSDLTSSSGSDLGNFNIEGLFMQLGALGASVKFDVKRLETSTVTSSLGYAIPDNARIKLKISLPTSDSSTVFGSIDWGQNDFSLSAGNSTMKIDPAGDATLYKWSMSKTANRVIVEVFGVAKQTSRAIDSQYWFDRCSVTVTSTVTQQYCGSTAEISSGQVIIVDVNPASFSLSYSSNATMQLIAGGLVSTNAQAVGFGERTTLGTAFEFGVAGPSVTESGTARSAVGFYHICVPGDFLSDKFSTTPAAAASSWVGKRDGSTTTSNTFSAANCGTGESGLVSSLVDFGYSTPMFAVQPGSSSGGGGSVVTICPTPVISSISPAYGPSAGGTKVTITGTDLSSTIYVATKLATIVSTSSTLVTFTTPAGTKGVAVVKVENCGSATTNFNYDPAPTVSSLSKSQVSTAGDQITITGTYLLDSKITLGTSAVTIVSSSENSLVIKTPVGVKGASTLTVSTPYGSAIKDLTLVDPPAFKKVTMPYISRGVATSVDVSASDATSYQITSGSLPSGLTLDSVTGKISGTSLVDGTFNISLSATGPGGTTSSTLTLDVDRKTPSAMSTNVRFTFGSGALSSSSVSSLKRFVDKVLAVAPRGITPTVTLVGGSKGTRKISSSDIEKLRHKAILDALNKAGISKVTSKSGVDPNQGYMVKVTFEWKAPN